MTSNELNDCVKQHGVKMIDYSPSPEDRLERARTVETSVRSTPTRVS